VSDQLLASQHQCCVTVVYCRPRVVCGRFLAADGEVDSDAIRP